MTKKVKAKLTKKQEETLVKIHNFTKLANEHSDYFLIFVNEETQDFYKFDDDSKALIKGEGNYIVKLDKDTLQGSVVSEKIHANFVKALKDKGYLETHWSNKYGFVPAK